MARMMFGKVKILTPRNTIVTIKQGFLAASDICIGQDIKKKDYLHVLQL